MQLVSALPLPITVKKNTLFTQLPYVEGISVTEYLTKEDLMRPDLEGQIAVLGNRFHAIVGEKYNAAYVLVNHALNPVQYYVFVVEKGAGFWVRKSDVVIG